MLSKASKASESPCSETDGGRVASVGVQVKPAVLNNLKIYWKFIETLIQFGVQTALNFKLLSICSQATSSPPPEPAGEHEMNRVASLSAFEQLVDNAEKLRLRQEMEAFEDNDN